MDDLQEDIYRTLENWYDKDLSLIPGVDEDGRGVAQICINALAIFIGDLLRRECPPDKLQTVLEYVARVISATATGKQ